jgi:single-strand DNA-binding protein
MNKVLLTGRLTRDPEMRVLASGKNVTTFTVATTEFLDPIEKVQYHAVVTWDRLAELAGTYLGHGQRVAIEGRLQTRTWDDDRGQRHWKTEVIAEKLELLDGARVDDFQAAANPQTATTLPSQRDPVPGL